MMNRETGNTHGLFPTGFQMQEDVAMESKTDPSGLHPWA